MPDPDAATTAAGFSPELPDPAITAAAAALHEHYCDPHYGHESEQRHAFPHPLTCVDCSTDDEDVEYFRGECDPDMDPEVAAVALAAARPVIVAEARADERRDLRQAIASLPTTLTALHSDLTEVVRVDDLAAMLADLLDGDTDAA